MEENCLICRKEISEKTIKKNDGRICNECTAKSTVCNAPGCFKKAVWRTITGEQLCPVHLENLEAEEFIY